MKTVVTACSPPDGPEGSGAESKGKQLLRCVGGVLTTLLLGGCLGMPKAVEPVDNFELDRYLGTWYEIARLDHSFERGLERVTATYSIHPDGGVRVVNRGYSRESGKWQEAEGRAYFVGSEDIGHLKVSFFGPFYASYVVFELDEEYSRAWVTSSDTSYLWYLSRSPAVDEGLLEEFVETAGKKGFPVDGLIFVRH